MKQKLLTGLIFGEGGQDKKFIQKLLELKKFKFHTQKWYFNYDNASGGSAKDILQKCHKQIIGKEYDLVICFIDLDDLKNDYPKKWEKEKSHLESEYKNLHIFWQINNREEEIKKSLPELNKLGKKKLNSQSIKLIDKFINSDFYKRILKIIKDKEKELMSH